jgi:hypothetical protein
MPCYNAISLLYVCILSSKALFQSDIRYPRYLNSDTCSIVLLYMTIFTLCMWFPHIAIDYVLMFDMFSLYFPAIKFRRYAIRIMDYEGSYYVNITGAVEYCCTVTNELMRLFSLQPLNLILSICLADPSGRAVYVVGLRPSACWDRGFESHWRHRCLSLVQVSVRGLCDRPIPRPEESYRLWCVSECDQVKIKNLEAYCEWVEEVRTTKEFVSLKV